MPKKQDSDSATSNTSTINAVTNARRRVCVIAELITKRFCMPIGAIYANPIVKPCR